MTEANPKPKSVLLIDDDDEIRDIYRIVLSKAGFEVDSAAGGQEGLRKLGSSPPDVVILDLMMPNCSGFEVLMNIQQGPGRKPPVIVITGVHKDAETVQRVRMEPIIFDFLFKPVKPATLVETVRRAIPAKLP